MDFNLEDAQVLLYISNKTSNFKEIEELAINAHKSWETESNLDAFKLCLYLLQNNTYTSSVLLNIVNASLQTPELVEANLSILEQCGKLKSSNQELLNTLFKILGKTDDSTMADQTSHIIAILLPQFESNPLQESWWPSIVSCIEKSSEKKHTMAALRAWLACASHNHTSDAINQVVKSDGNNYFRLLEPKVAEASKFALQTLQCTFLKLKFKVDNEYIRFDPVNQDTWKRYTSLIEVLGIDTSVHQTMGSLPDFVALFNKNSVIPGRWMTSLVNVGLCISNTEGIRVLTMEMLMSLHISQMDSLTSFPKFTANVVFPKLLQTPNFVVINDNCIHSDHFERFCHNLLSAYLEFSNNALNEFLNYMAVYFLEHAHCFEAPRALFSQAMLDVLPSNSVNDDILNKFLLAAEATNTTYNSKAMADLYLDLVRKVILKVSGPSSLSLKDKQTFDDQISQALLDLETNGYFTRDNFVALNNANITFKSNETFSKFNSLLQISTPPSTLNESTLLLQASILDNTSYIDSKTIHAMLNNELKNPTPMCAKDRMQLSDSVELAFDLVKSVDFDLLEIAFQAFTAVPTRLAALKAFRRSNPTQIPLENMEILWNSLKDATLRFIDRELHHEFIDLVTTPHAIEEPPTDICIEIVQMSLRRRNLLTPLAIGLFRHIDVSPLEPWVHVVMARIFAFMKSFEYTVRFEEIIANRYGIYEEKWGRPESQARALAAYYLKTAKSEECGDAVISDTLELAQFSKQITGSLDNPEAHLRVLFCQILILVQSYSSYEPAMDLLKTVTSSLEHEANPPVRMHSEWLVGILASTHLAGDNFNEFVLGKIADLDGGRGTPPRVLSSMIRICLLLYYIQFSKKIHGHEEIGKSFVEHLLPLATSNKAVLRHRSISALYIINQREMAPRHLHSIVETCARINSQAVLSSTHQNESYLWDLTDTRLGPVCGGVMSTVFDKYMPQTLLTNDFDAIAKLININSDVIGPCWSPEKVVSRIRNTLLLPDLIEAREKVVADAIKQGLNAEFSSSMQTKSGNFDVEYHARRTELIVVATLCDKPVNLGAICRLSDALGAKSMTIKDMSVLSDQNFKSTALTAEKWIPIEEVTETLLKDFLIQKKTEGYSLIGIEQTDTSKVLKPNLQFPTKTVLMMGHEKQGIPAELLSILDDCIEIEQLGYVRSMNIQTATAVVVHAYNHQHSSTNLKLNYK